VTGCQPGGSVVSLAPERVKPFAGQPRKRFRGVKQLADSIRLIGQVTPIIVTPCEEDGFVAELVDGERRLLACRLLRRPVLAVLDSDPGAAERYARSVAANFCRQGHDAVEIMEAVLTLKADGRTNNEIAEIFGKTHSWVCSYLLLQRLHPDVLDQLKVEGDEAKLSRREKRRRGRMTLSLALLLAPLDQRVQVKAMLTILDRKMSLAAARTFVHRMAGATGLTIGKKMTAPQRFRAIRSAVENCGHVVERYLTMPGSQIRSLVAGAVLRERREMAKLLESLCESLLMLADELDKAGGRE